MAVDALAVVGMHYWSGKPLLIEIAFFGMMVPGYLWAYLRLRRRTGGQEAARIPNSSIRSELSIFAASTVKEIRQQWKTRRALVLGAVFLFFGMGSPLITKLTPEILRSVQGGELIAQLMPQPTAVDAMGQYIKNLTQFGFLLAILMAMGAVVGEKETRVAPMILSKPMPRWAFITGKFAAQCLMYSGAFVLAGIGAYYYIWIFGPIAPGAFLLMNFLLLMWTLSFVALSLLGSVLGKSTASAGGIAAALCIGLLLAGSIPQYGALLPTGLVGWASQAAQTSAGINRRPPTLSRPRSVNCPSTAARWLRRLL